MSSQCVCPRCGFESSCSHGRWVDRHPAAAVSAAVVFGLPAGYTLVGVMLVYPWFTIPVTIIVCAFLLNRLARRRAAIAARADWEHREMMVRAMRQLPDRAAPPPRPPLLPPNSVRPAKPAPWHIVTQWPTKPLRKAGPR